METTTTQRLTDIWSSPAYAARVAELEIEGLTHSDAGAVADVEFGLVPIEQTVLVVL